MERRGKKEKREDMRGERSRGENEYLTLKGETEKEKREREREGKGVKHTLI